MCPSGTPSTSVANGKAVARIDSNHSWNASRLSSAAHAHPAPDALVLRDLPQRVLVPGLERLEPHALALEGYVKRQVPPSSNERRIRRATTILCTSSAPS